MIFSGFSTNTRSPRREGFTLIELLVVIAIMATLATLLLPSGFRALDSSRKAACMSNLRQIGVAMPLFASDFNMCFPPPNSDADAFPSYGAYPRWYNLLQPYIQKQSQSQKTVWRCPGDNRGTNITCSYGMNINASPYSNTNTSLIPLSSLPGPTSQIIYCADSGQLTYVADQTWWNDPPGGFGGITKGANLEYRHMGSKRDQTKHHVSPQEVTDQHGAANFLFFDGHVETFRDDQLTKLMFCGH